MGFLTSAFFLMIFLGQLGATGNAATREAALVSTLQGEAATLKPLNLNRADVNFTKKFWVVAFVSSRCPCSNSHHQELMRLHDEFKEFTFLAFQSGADETAEEGLAVFKEFPSSFPVFYDSEQRVLNAFKAVKTPHVFILDQKGEILFQGGVTNSAHFDRASEFFLKSALTSIRENKKIANSVTKTLGCYIQRKNGI